jgi:hypothetical protein
VSTETADYRCPDCGRETCTGEDCYWPDAAGIRRPEREETAPAAAGTGTNDA